MLFSPLIPNNYPLFENIELFLVCHRFYSLLTAILISGFAKIIFLILSTYERASRRIRICPVPDKINTVTRRGIGSDGHQTEELYARVQTESGVGKHAA